MADLMKSGSKSFLGRSDSIISNEGIVSDTSDDLISLEYLTISEERPSASKAMRLATLQFNTLNCIGRLKDTVKHSVTCRTTTTSKIHIVHQHTNFDLIQTVPDIPQVLLRYSSIFSILYIAYSICI